MDVKTKTPGEEKRFEVDFSARLGAGEIILTVTWIVPTGLSTESSLVASPSVSALFAGGIEGTRYTVTSQITTSGGNTLEEDFVVSVER